MMNECNYYPKKLFIHDYEHMHWKWSNDELIQLLTQFFSRLESLDLLFRQEKDIDHYTYVSTTGQGFELVLNCCLFRSLFITDPVGKDRTAFLLTLATQPCLFFKKLDICYFRHYRVQMHHLLIS